MRAVFKSPLILALAVMMACVPLGLTEPFEFVYWNSWFKLFSHDAPRNVVVISLDGGESSTNGRIVGSTALQANLLDTIVAARPRHIYFDFPMAAGADKADDAGLVRSIVAAGPLVTMVARGAANASSELTQLKHPKIDLPDSVAIASSAWYVNFYGYAGGAPARADVAGRRYPSVAIFESHPPSADSIVYPDFAMDPDSATTLVSADILSRTTGAAGLTGKTVFVSTTDPTLGTAVGYFGHGRVASVMLDIAGGQGLSRGPGRPIGKLPFVALFVVLITLGHRAKSLGRKLPLYLSLLAALLLLPGMLSQARIIGGSDWAIFALLIYAPARLWQRWRRGVELTSVASGLPNIAALAADGIPAGVDVIAACIREYEQVLASLPRELHGDCARQIARRLALASGNSAVHDNDNGCFVWIEEPRPMDEQVEHLQGLKALFSAPLVVDGILLDTNIHFGIDRNVENTSIRRIQSALASATEAQRKGQLFDEFARQKLVEAPWQLSLNARIDEGLRNGDIWLALQPQYDCRTGKIFGAEALIRWNDPERGVIPPDAFILQAERVGRIEAITYWVLERAIEASQTLNATWSPFQLSVNLSARMVDQPGLIERITEIVRRHDFDCSTLTFEVTETFSMSNRQDAKRNLAALREMGFRLSIDDFGTGQASLAYLAEIPSDELKLDKQFVQAVTTDRRQRVIVHSMIRLAHSLGQEVVAEGVEDLATLEALKRMRCDLIQGYYIAYPQKLESLIAWLTQTDNGERIRS